jgi:hypothetical protein
MERTAKSIMNREMIEDLVASVIPAARQTRQYVELVELAAPP